jgi:hypothetical protein
MPKSTEKQLNRQEEEAKALEKGVLPPEYSDIELKYRSFLIKRLTDAKNQRSSKWDELDGMDFQTYYDTNAKAGNSYNPPKENKQDTKIVTGTTLEKENALLNSLLNLNFEPNVEAFDKNDLPISSLGKTMESMIIKSRTIENYNDDKRRLIYKEILDQGTTYVEEVENQYIIPDKVIDMSSITDMDPEKMIWSYNATKVYDECESNLIPSTFVYLGNMREFDMEKQPFIFTLEYIPYELAEAKYKNWKRFKNVPRTIRETVVSQKDSSDSGYRQWRLYDLLPEFVEVIKYQDKWANEYMVMLNGEMMLKPGFPLSYFSGGCFYTISKGDIEPISAKFSISKSYPAKTKVSQAVLDEFLRMFIIKIQKSAFPPMANKGGQILSKKVFFPSNITPNLNPDDLKEIGTNNGITPGDVNGYELVKNIVEEMTVSSQFQGLDNKTKTATQTLEDKKQNLIKIGMAVFGIMALERQMCYKRLYNILRVWTKATETKIDDITGQLQNIYRSVSVPAEFDGTSGIRQITLTDQNYKTPEEVASEEISYKRETGVSLQRIYLNPEILKMIKNRWYIEIVQTDKNTSEFKKLMFINNLKEAIAIWGIENVNLDGLKARWAQLSGEDIDTYFVKGAPSAPMMDQNGQVMEPQQTRIANQVTPNANTLAGMAA